MMRRDKQPSFKENDVISASEIGQYHYCSMSWFLQKCGFEPKSPMLEVGARKHIQLGKTIDYTRINAKKSKFFAIVGYLLFTFAVLILIYEVIRWLSIF
jgi:hypothetical protein